MKATRSNKSWEKQTIWDLDNGWQATEEWNQHYGPFIKALKSPDGKIWQASNGNPGDTHSIGGAQKANEIFGGDKYIDLPAWAESWREEKTRLVRPNFEK